MCGVFYLKFGSVDKFLKVFLAHCIERYGQMSSDMNGFICQYLKKECNLSYRKSDYGSFVYGLA